MDPDLKLLNDNINLLIIISSKLGYLNVASALMAVSSAIMLNETLSLADTCEKWAIDLGETNPQVAEILKKYKNMKKGNTHGFTNN